MDYAHPDAPNWRHHPRPWRRVDRWKLLPNGEHLDAVLDAAGRVVLTSYGVGFETFWNQYLASPES